MALWDIDYFRLGNLRNRGRGRSSEIQVGVTLCKKTFTFIRENPICGGVPQCTSLAFVLNREGMSLSLRAILSLLPVLFLVTSHNQLHLKHLLLLIF